MVYSLLYQQNSQKPQKRVYDREPEGKRERENDEANY